MKNTILHKDCDALDRVAMVFAEKVHKDCTYERGSFFLNHLCRVVGILVRDGETDPIILAAAWLHDVVEDTDITIDEIREQFGNDVADLVYRLTNKKLQDPQIKLITTLDNIAGNRSAVKIKLADRIANVRSCLSNGDKRIIKYLSQYGSFKKFLWRRNEYERMWIELDSLHLQAQKISVPDNSHGINLDNHTSIKIMSKVNTESFLEKMCITT